MIQLIPDAGATFGLADPFALVDDANWNARAQSSARTLPDSSGQTGLILRESKRVSGRPRTLKGSMVRGDLEALQALAETGPAITLRTTGRGDISARFNFEGGPAVFGDLLIGAIEPPGADDWFAVTIRLIEV